MTKIQCPFCGYRMDKNILGPIDIVVCPDCRTKLRIEMVSATTPSGVMMIIQILKEGKRR